MPLPDNSTNGRSTPRLPPAPGGDGQAFGEFLRRAREDSGLTLEQISSETKIPRWHLDALERGNWAAIPGGLYRRAETRAYARAIRLDPNLALMRLEQAVQASAPREAVPEPAPAPSGARSGAYPRLVIGVVAATVAVGLAVWGQPGPVNGGVQALGAADAGGPSAEAPGPAAPDAPVHALDVSNTPRQRSEPPAARLATNARAAALDGAQREDPRPSASQGGLEVITEPAGARVTINGIGWGSTPVTIRHLPPGAKRIRVTKEGYGGVERAVHVGEDRPTTTIRIQLAALP